MRAIVFIAIAFLALEPLAAKPTSKAPKKESLEILACSLTEADKARNRTLDWATFDQDGSEPKNWRALEAKGCHLVAAEAAADYLAHGPMPQSERWHSSTRFHMAQSLAFAGNNNEAAKVAATARRLEPVSGLDWNTYVSGTFAFLVKDKVGLRSAQQRLALSVNSGDSTNNGVLLGLIHCFDRPYKVAYDLECRTNGGWKMPETAKAPLAPAP